MLILSRKLQETIMIGDHIEVCVLSFDETRVRLGISAPRIVPVHRAEIYYQIKSQKIHQANNINYLTEVNHNSF